MLHNRGPTASCDPPASGCILYHRRVQTLFAESAPTGVHVLLLICPCSCEPCLSLSSAVLAQGYNRGEHAQSAGSGPEPVERGRHLCSFLVWTGRPVSTGSCKSPLHECAPGIFEASVRCERSLGAGPRVSFACEHGSPPARQSLFLQQPNKPCPSRQDASALRSTREHGARPLRRVLPCPSAARMPSRVSVALPCAREPIRGEGQLRPRIRHLSSPRTRRTARGGCTCVRQVLWSA
ncbi:hypothetical protein PsYK624_117800 [Phanerochaete sordida]|uniref:Uncharacterized protein n=1 Tax=Phanerochaete sordida TaxID=48140 RepID=A0A9P3GJU7_9APHY|nr:hypothetical protein PsYK624_117800 [Phanerochaete sordida]